MKSQVKAPFDNQTMIDYLVGSLEVLTLNNDFTPSITLLKPGSFIAGGAIGNLILSKVFDLKLQVNDIDVFIDESVTNPNFEKKEVDEDQGYLDAYSPEEKQQFKIKKAERLGLLNVITTESIQHLDQESYTEMVLESFDFNCVGAGIYLDEELNWHLKLSYAFEKLLETKEVAITNLTHPARTFVRLFKKKKELYGLYFKKNDETRIISAIAYGKRQFFSKTTLTKYLKLVPIEFRGAFSFKQHKEIFFELIPNLNHHKIISLNHKEIFACGKNTAKIICVVNAKVEFNKSLKSKYKIIAGYPHLLKLALSIGLRSSLLFQPKAKDLILANRALSNIPNLNKYNINFIIPNSFNISVKILAEFYTLLESDLAFSQLNFKSEFYGYIECHFNSLVTGITSLLSVKNKFLTLYTSLYVEIVKPLKLRTKLEEFSYRELTSPCFLVKEGEEMGHCVGGYRYKIEHLGSRIFSVQSNDGIRSTLEISLGADDERAFIVQHRTRFNKPVNNSHMDFAIKLIGEIRELQSTEKTTSELKNQELTISA